MKRAILVMIALVATIGFTALGVWQIERRAWKLDLIERVAARVHADPVPIPAVGEWASFAPDAAEYRRVRLSGVFMHDRATRVQALTEIGAGFWLIVPMRTSRGVVLVNRGFVPPASDATRLSRPNGKATVTGLLRVSEPGGAFLRSNDPGQGRWYSRDVAAIARAQRIGPVAPFFVDADAAPNAGGYPVGGLTVVRFNNNHLVYALTWFALAALSGYGAFRFARSVRPA